MGDRTRRAAATIVLTLCGFAMASIWLSSLWRRYAGDPGIRIVLGVGVVLWIASDIVMWFHVWLDIRTTLKERSLSISSLPMRFPVRSTRNHDV
jgi:hypothetical protein